MLEHFELCLTESQLSELAEMIGDYAVRLEARNHSSFAVKNLAGRSKGRDIEVDVDGHLIRLLGITGHKGEKATRISHVDPGEWEAVHVFVRFLSVNDAEIWVALALYNLTDAFNAAVQEFLEKGMEEDAGDKAIDQYEEGKG